MSYPSYNVTFEQFQTLNARRCNEAFVHGVDGWPIENWALAIAGEAGELCNLVKKVIRGDFPIEEKRQEILRELAMTFLRASTGDEVMDKFDLVSERVGWSQ